MIKKVKGLFEKKKPAQDYSKHVATGEVPNLNFNPHLLNYIENGWVNLVKTDDGEPFLLNGKRLYSIDNIEEGLRMSRLFKINALMQQSKECGLTKENILFNMDTLVDICDNAKKSNDIEQIYQAFDLIKSYALGMKRACDLGLNDELVFRVSALTFCFQDEDPREFNATKWMEKVNLFRENHLSFFFFTKGFKPLSASLGLFMQDTQSFLNNLLQTLSVENQVSRSLIAMGIETNLIGNDDTMFGLYEKQVADLLKAGRCLDEMRLSFTIGSQQ
jgi:hypothetical protein